MNQDEPATPEMAENWQLAMRFVQLESRFGEKM